MVDTYIIYNFVKKSISTPFSSHDLHYEKFILSSRAVAGHQTYSLFTEITDMEPVIMTRIASVTAMPLVLAGGWASTPQYQQTNQYSYETPLCVVIATAIDSSVYSIDVVHLQKFLIDAGYMSGTMNGYLDQPTRTALKQFQADHGLPVTGRVDSQTRRIIEQVSCAGSPYLYEGRYYPNYSTDRYSGPSSQSSTAYRGGVPCTGYNDHDCYVAGSAARISTTPLTNPTYQSLSSRTGAVPCTGYNDHDCYVVHNTSSYSTNQYSGSSCIYQNGRWIGDCMSTTHTQTSYTYCDAYRTCYGSAQGRTY